MTVLFILFVVGMVAYIRFLLWIGEKAAVAGRDLGRKVTGQPPIPSSAQLRREWEDRND